ncbi:MAG: hypothetical protein MPN21_11720 [Thermoanaerobaculia bacterium]|nr:hypothetical protein [Thermoanaerobaculia bacterium]
MIEYEIVLEDPMQATLPERVRTWFAEECPALWLEVVPDRYVLYNNPEVRQIDLERVISEPIQKLIGRPCVVLMDGRVLLASRRDEATDQALRAFAEWLSTQVEYDLYDGPLPIPPSDLTNPELYE